MAAHLSAAPTPRRMRGFNVKFKSDTHGCFNVHTLAFTSSDALQTALNEFACFLRQECEFSVSVSVGPDPDIVRYQLRKEAGHG